MQSQIQNHPAASNTEATSPRMRLSPFGRLIRFFASWFGFTGLYAAFSVCPFCGQPACPTGLLASGVVGGFLALCIQDWKRLLLYLKTKRKKGK